MNHLCGLNVPCPTESCLPPSDLAALSAFRGVHEANRPPSSSSLVASNEDACSHEVDPSTLPPCGWRPLDDATLYRFLCADRRGGQFQPEKSAVRLQRALSFRKEEGVDEILRSFLSKGCARGGDSLPSPLPLEGSVVTAASTRNYDRCDSIHSLTSFASGTMTDDGSAVRDVARVDNDKSNKVKAVLGQEDDDDFEVSTHSTNTAATVATTQQPKFDLLNPADLSRYQRLRVRVFVGRDRLGQPVLFERLGHFLASGNCDHYTTDQWIIFYIWDLERHFVEMRSASEESGVAITRFTYVADAEGIIGGIMNRAVWKVIPLLKALVSAVEDHYPEIADKIVLFNVPRIASVFYRAVKTFLDPVTADKIEIHAGVPMDVLEGIMDRSVVPKEYGGTNGVHFPLAATE